MGLLTEAGEVTGRCKVSLEQLLEKIQAGVKTGAVGVNRKQVQAFWNCSN